VAEFQLREIDAEIVQRVRALARERGCGVNEVFLLLIRDALGLAEVEAGDSTMQARTVTEVVPEQLADEEAAVLRAAMEALEQLPEDRSAFRTAGREAKK
jgi:hypothetical protein